MKVTAYTKHNTEHEFSARGRDHAREIAKRIITEGLWIVDSGIETFYPITEVFKAKVTD